MNKLVETHVHFGGYLFADIIWHIIHHTGQYYLAETEDDVIQSITYAYNEPRDFHRFLHKFNIQDEINWTPDIIELAIKAVSVHLNKYHYTLLDLSINKYLVHLKWHKRDIIKFIYDKFQEHAPGKVGLMLSLKYEATQASQRQHAQLIEDQTASDCLVGIDLVGDEGQFDHEFYKPIFKEWNAAGKITRAHVGESQSHHNIRLAIEELGVSRVAHGFKILQDPELVALAKERGIYFDLALSSNYYTGILEQYHPHPIKDMLDAGLFITLGSDDPAQFDTNLEKEYELAKKHGITEDQCELIRQTSFYSLAKLFPTT